MPFIPVPLTVRLAFEYSAGPAIDAVNVLHVRSVNPVVLGQVNDIVAAAHLWWDNELRPLQENAWRLDRIRGVDLSAPNSYEVDFGVGVSGGHNEAQMPANVTIALSLRTGLSGRSFRGRLYHVGLARDQVAGDVLATGVANDLIVAYSGLLTAFTGLDAELVVVSYVSEGAPRAEGLATPVTSITIVNQTLDHQDRRLPRGH